MTSPAGDYSSVKIADPGHPVYRSGTDGYHTFRIPAIIRTGDGDLLAFAEGRRHSPEDTGDIDVVLRRSTDGGRTWDPLRVVTSHGDDVAGNPTPVIDPASGDVVLVTCRNGGDVTERDLLRGTVPHEQARRVYVQRSPDGGGSWSEPEEITASVKQGTWRWYATGPGHAIALASDTAKAAGYAGRLVVPANHSVPGMAPGSYGAHAILSDDGGRTWRIGVVDRGTRGWVNPNESTVAELPDGALLFNARDQHGRNPANRVQARSVDGGQSFSETYDACSELITPVCAGSLLAVGGLQLFAGPSDPDKRVGMSVRRSRDGGRTWRRIISVTDGPSAYSDLVPLPDQDAGTERIGFGLLYEGGSAGPYEEIRFTALSTHP